MSSNSASIFGCFLILTEASGAVGFVLGAEIVLGGRFLVIVSDWSWIEFLRGLAVPSEYFDFILRGLLGSLIGDTRPFLVKEETFREMAESVEEREGECC